MSVKDAFRRLREQYKAKESMHYLSLGQDQSLGIWPQPDKPGRLVLGAVRRNGLPDIEQAGQRSPLDLDDDQNLLECTHAMLFKNGVLGAEFNFHGPRVTRLSQYLEEICCLPRLSIEPIIKSEAAEKLARMGAIKRFELKIHRDQLTQLKRAERSLFEAFEVLHQESEAPLITVSLQQERYGKNGLGDRVRGMVNAIATSKNFRQNCERFVVRAYDKDSERTEKFDFLNDLMIQEEEVLPENPRSRAVDSDSMFKAIRKAYGRVKDVVPELASMEAT